MNLKNFKKDRLQHMEHFQFAGRVLQLCREANVEKLTAVLDPLKKAVEETIWVKVEGGKLVKVPAPAATE